MYLALEHATIIQKQTESQEELVTLTSTSIKVISDSNVEFIHKQQEIQKIIDAHRYTDLILKRL